MCWGEENVYWGSDGKREREREREREGGGERETEGERMGKRSGEGGWRGRESYGWEEIKESLKKWYRRLLNGFIWLCEQGDETVAS